MARRKTIDEVRAEVESHGLELLSTSYTSNKDNLVMKCHKHGEITMTLANLNTRKECSRCAVDRRNKNKRHTPEEVEIFVNSLGYKLYNIIDTGGGKHKRLIVSCERGHTPYNVTYQNLKTGRRCPFCSMSSGESIVYEELLSNGLDFDFNYPISVGDKTLLVDFCIHTNYGDLFVEVDGAQHFNVVTLFGDDNKLLKQKENDRLKNDYALENDIPLLRLINTRDTPLDVNKLLTFLRDNDTL
ncbi:hypothetical protein [Bacillus thuringiensis]|uniref:hypothetical protein n=1 Tax=Bacillus thuringiensis TaxID=1428 RepID=UPI000A3996A8|nr:hypothetical protein [Bacillus thuringiensis]OTZ58608.1 hypothetical protein BK762_00335 [Bacillus thuringiensis serovar toumanoffi]